ncbi:MAG: mimic ocr, partial [Pseudomonadota bacterium]
LISALEDEKLDILLDSYPEDRISEMADSRVPIYYSELAQCLADDTSLAELEDEGLAEGVTDVFKRIQIAIYERLSGVAYQWLSEVQEAFESEQDDEEAA